MTEDERMARRLFWAVLGFAAAVRAAFWILFPVADDGNQSYIQPALELLGSGKYESFGTLHRLPGAPWFFAAVFAVFGRHPPMVTFLQHLLGLGTLALAADAARRAWGARAGALAALFLALQFQFPFQECFLLSETLAQFFMALSLDLALRLRGDGGPGRGAAAGAACAAAALTRGELVILGPLFAAAALTGRAASPRRRFTGAALLLALWAVPVGGWALRNWALFGYFGLTPDSVTTMTDTALPMIRADGASEPLARGILLEQAEAARSTPGLDPRPTTIERLQKEHGYSYLQAETALGRISWETAASAPLAYARLAAENFRLYVVPARWADTGGHLPSVAERVSASDAAAWFWRRVGATQGWGWALLALAALAPAACLRGAPGRDPVILIACSWALLWTAMSLSDRIVPRIQAELYLPLGLLAAAGVDALAGFVMMGLASRGAPGDRLG